MSTTADRPDPSQWRATGMSESDHATDVIKRKNKEIDRLKGELEKANDNTRIWHEAAEHNYANGQKYYEKAELWDFMQKHITCMSYSETIFYPHNYRVWTKDGYYDGDTLEAAVKARKEKG